MMEIPQYVQRVDVPYCEVDGVDAADSDCVNSIRCLSAAMVTHGKSGHPGAPMGCAVMGHALFGHVMKYRPSDFESHWARDRFVLSNGHGSALLYSLLHLAGVDMSLNDLKSFRQLGSKTPGHPECERTIGVEVTTGPLGQGIAQAVGLAIGARIMRATYGSELFNNRTYVIMGDGCMQEGVAQEACSLAGHLKLGGLVVLYDRNGISIDGDTSLSFTEDVSLKYRAWGWHVLYVANGNTDLKGIIQALRKADEYIDLKPVLIIVDTTIGYGSLKQGTEKVHGSPLTEADILQLRKKCGFSQDDIWTIPESVTKFYQKRQADLEGEYRQWQAKLGAKTADELKTRFNRDRSEKLWKAICTAYDKEEAEAPRNISEMILKVLSKEMKDLVGGSADLMGSNKTNVVKELDGAFDAIKNPKGRYIHFGVREHGMAAITNGLAAYGSFRPFNATFLNFYTYSWGATRLSALCGFPVLMIATHDSIELGEDGPTHQPIETVALMRATPNFLLFRPADAREVAGSYIAWMKSQRTPVAIALARGKTPQLSNTSTELTHTKGGYILADFNRPQDDDQPKIIIGGSGSELHIALEARDILIKRHNMNVRVISMPSWNLFHQQNQQYKDSVLLPIQDTACRRGYIEPYNNFGFERYFDTKYCLSLPAWGDSAPAKDLYSHYKFTGEEFAKKFLS